MKKLIFTLLALVGTMSMNAQLVEIYDGDQVILRQMVPDGGKVVFKKRPPTTGTAQRNGETEDSKVDVNWVQLWDFGPKFAEYNVGAANNNATDFGGYYAWGGTYENGPDITWNNDHYTGESDLSGLNDTATKLWGSNWRMPTKEEFDNLIANCTCTFIEDYKETGVKGLLFRGKGVYSDNTIFLPAAGYYTSSGASYISERCDYWYSALSKDGWGGCLSCFYSIIVSTTGLSTGVAASVRPVLVEE